MSGSEYYDALDRLFHEPGRLSIMSVLCESGRGVSFVELKDACGLTDGNLNRHLKVLEDAGVVRIKKAFVDSKPRTTAAVTANGVRKFNEYVAALSEVLKRARKALPVSGSASMNISGLKHAEA